MTVYPGHKQYAEGSPVRLADCAECQRAPQLLPASGKRSAKGIGHGSCLCGAHSDHTTTVTARRRWHTAHLAEMELSRADIFKADGQSRLQAHLDKSAGPDGCWPFTGRRHPFGHGYFQVDMATKGAHVWSYLWYVGEIPEGQLVRHTCDNPPCCNPKHLLAGTYADNKQDCVDRNRHATGEDHPHARLTEAQVAEIRKASAEGETNQSLRRRYGVAWSTIQNVVLGRTWKSAA